MRKQVLVTGFVLLSLLPLKVSAQEYEKIYIFGDSLSDVGNLFQATGGTVPPSPPYFQGRFSDGPLWIDYLANDLGATTTNLAFSGATTGSINTTPGATLLNLPGLKQQIDSFTTTNSSADSNALYVVWAGANDYLGANVTDPSVPVNNLTTAVTTLANYGAKDIMVVNLPDLGKLPAVNRNSEIATGVSALTNAHNLGLDVSLDSLSAESNVNIVPLDVNSLFNQAIATPNEFGFTNVSDACLTEAGVCSNPNEYLFWDNLHPTTAAHKLVGELALSALESKPVPEPSATLGMLALGGLGIVGILKRKHKISSTSYKV